MTTKEKLNFDKHGMRIIGTADDSFNKKRNKFGVETVNKRI